ncbi:MAG: AraC family transcriptional regulator [Pseudomonadales bacterium]|nr:AraC family transcriptional regulator [Pseudomonadales bacterium]
MPVSSGWPLKPGGVRFFVPIFACQQLAAHPLTRHLYIEGLGYYPKAVGHTMERLEHDDCLLLYCIEGKGSLAILGEEPQEFPINKGDLVLIPKGIQHHYKSHANQPWTMYWAHFNGASARAYIDQITGGQSKFVVPLGHQSKLITDFKNLLSVQKTGYQFSRFIYASNLLAQMLSFIAVIAPSGTTANTYGFELEKVKQLMEENIANPLELEALAEHVNLSKFHFSKKYKEITGYSPIQHFIHMKMERACYLLDISDQSVSQIGETLGYEDAQYFSRLFKKVVGISPRDYRKLDRG